MWLSGCYPPFPSLLPPHYLLPLCSTSTRTSKSKSKKIDDTGDDKGDGNRRRQSRASAKAPAAKAAPIIPVITSDDEDEDEDEEVPDSEDEDSEAADGTDDSLDTGRPAQSGIFAHCHFVTARSAPRSAPVDTPLFASPTSTSSPPLQWPCSVSYH